MQSKQGQSLVTASKQRKFAAALLQGLSIAAKVCPGQPFFHLDTNAGSGRNEEVGVDGSPLVAFEQADKAGHTDFRPMFVDINPAAAAALERRLRGRASIIFSGDNSEFLEWSARWIKASANPRYAIGAVLIDPNGWFYRNAKGEGAPVEAVRRFAMEFPRIDVVMNLNVATYQRMKGINQKSGAPVYASLIGPSELMSSLGKSHWAISDIESCGGDRFVVMVGRNISTSNLDRYGLFKVDSERGREIILDIEGKRQLRLL